jgi:thiazole/oxazole-forming peptide maturase SagC family component
MTEAYGSLKLRALPVQFIDISDGVIIKRGCTEVRIVGTEASKGVHRFFAELGEDALSREQILERFAESSRLTIGKLIDQLVVRRLLISEQETDLPPERVESNLDIFYWHFGESEARINERLNSKSFAIVGVNTISRQLARTFAASGINNVQVIDDPLLRNLRMFDERADLNSAEWPETIKPPQKFTEWVEDNDPISLQCVVVSSDCGNTTHMRQWNRLCVERGLNILPAFLKDMIGYIGPYTVPGETACFECMQSRRNAHLQDAKHEEELESAAFHGQIIHAFHPAMASVLGDIAAFEITKFCSGVLPKGNISSLIEINLLATYVTARRVLKVPNCVVCSSLNKHPSTNFQKDLISSQERTGK